MERVTSRISVSQINQLDYEEFIKIFGNTVEHCYLVAAAVWKYRPFRDVGHIHEEMCKFMDQLPMEGGEGILRLHPDLAGKAAREGTLTSESTKEQRAAGLSDITPEEKTQLANMNQSYRSKFGFPFVICARENKKEAIMNGMRTRLNNSQKVEVLTGIGEVKKICYLRLLDLVEHEGIESRL